VFNAGVPSPPASDYRVSPSLAARLLGVGLALVGVAVLAASVVAAVAIEDDDRFRVDERELKRGGPSYTVLTLEELRAERPAQPIVLILGMDAFAGLERWHRARELITLAHVVVALRPRVALPVAGLPAALLEQNRCDDPAQLSGSPAGLVHVCRNTELDLSSSAVRAVIAAGRDPRYLMPEAARRIILARGSYARPGERQE
jgi:nicotinate-nucleotide adenylyltransferase